MKRFFGAALTAGMLVGALPSQAMTVSQGFAFGFFDDPSITVTDPTVGSGSQSTSGSVSVGPVSSFDTSLGTLTGVRIEYSGDLTFRSALQDFGGSSASGTASVSAAFSLDVNTNGILDGGERLTSSEINIVDPISCTGLPCINEETPSAVFGSDSFAAAEWMTLTAGADFNLMFNYSLSANLISGSTFASLQVNTLEYLMNTGGRSKVTIFYDFELDDTPPAVPLPAGFPLLLAGIGGFAVLRKRQKAT